MPQFQFIAVGIACAAIFICWLVFSGTTFNVGLASIIAVAFFIASLGLTAIVGIFYAARKSIC